MKYAVYARFRYLSLSIFLLFPSFYMCHVFSISLVAVLFYLLFWFSFIIFVAYIYS